MSVDVAHVAHPQTAPEAIIDREHATAPRTMEREDVCSRSIPHSKSIRGLKESLLFNRVLEKATEQGATAYTT